MPKAGSPPPQMSSTVSNSRSIGPLYFLGTKELYGFVEHCAASFGSRLHFYNPPQRLENGSVQHGAQWRCAVAAEVLR